MQYLNHKIQFLQLSILAFIIILFCHQANAQRGMTELGNLEYEQNLNDVWGYADEEGNEYALVGTTTGFSIVDLNQKDTTISSVTGDTTITDSLVELHFIPGAESIWRDIKTAYNRAYVVNEEADGILICDLSHLPDSISYHRFNADSTLATAHNIYIDENNYAYVVGYNNFHDVDTTQTSVPTNDRGVMIFDLNQNPDEPVLIGNYTDEYVHDVYVRDNIMYTSELYRGEFALIDISDPANPIPLARQETPNSFTHNAWLSDNSRYLFTTDETGGAFVAAYDLNELDEIQEIDRYQSHPGQNITPHNVHVLDEFLVISYYKDGLIVVDAQQPDLLIPVERFDTNPNTGTGTAGCWGAYPYLPSRRILATDRTEGLFLIGARYDEASYIRGTVADSETGQNLVGVKVTVLGSDQIRYTNLFGEFKAGHYKTDWERTIRFEKFGYETKTITGDYFTGPGETTYLNVTLDPIEPLELTINVVDAYSGTLLDNVFLQMYDENAFLNGETTEEGSIEFDGIYPNAFNFLVGRWGYQSRQITQLDVDTNILTIALEPGYYDDFLFDFGWTTEETGLGAWTRGNPLGTSIDAGLELYCNPEFDVNGDIGNTAYVTGNSTSNLILDDVDSTTMTLISPEFDLGIYPDPYISFYLWYCHRKALATDNQIEIFLDNGTEKVSIDLIDPSDSTTLNWKHKSYRVGEFITPSANMQLEIAVTDFAGTSDSTDVLTEAGIDLFQVSDTLLNVGVNSISMESPMFVYPNPFTTNFNIELKRSGTISLMDLQGKVIEQYEADNNFSIQVGNNLLPNVYFIKWENGQNQFTEKVIKLK